MARPFIPAEPPFTPVQPPFTPVKPNERPKQFIISATGMNGFQGNLTQLQNEEGVDTLRNLGINTIMTADINTSHISNYPAEAAIDWPGLDVATVQDTLNKAGLKYRGISVVSPLDSYTSMQLYGPPASIVPTNPSIQTESIGYFDFYLHFNQQQLNDLAREVAIETKDSYAGDLSNVVEFHLLDEPNWFYGNVSGEVNMLNVLNYTGISPNPPLPASSEGYTSYLEIFQNYLSSLPQGFNPSDFVLAQQFQLHN